jgi:hypothetical protein
MSKVVFSAEKARKTITVELPSFPETELVFYTQLTVGEEREISQLFPNYTNKDHQDAMDFMRTSVVRLLKSWNFTDENNQDLPLESAETVFSQLPSGDVAHVLKTLQKSNENTVAASGLVQSQK